MNQSHIRNFAIIAHIDHGKSTLVPVEPLPFSWSPSTHHGGGSTGLRKFIYESI